MKDTRRLLPLPLPLLLLLLLVLVVVVMLLLLLLKEKYQKHLPAPKQQSTEARTNRTEKLLNVITGTLLELKT